MLLIDYRRS